MERFIGMPFDEFTPAYQQACPRRQLPLGDTPILLVTGSADEDVPSDMIEKFYSDVRNSSDGKLTV